MLGLLRRCRPAAADQRVESAPGTGAFLLLAQRIPVQPVWLREHGPVQVREVNRQHSRIRILSDHVAQHQVVAWGHRVVHVNEVPDGDPVELGPVHASGELTASGVPMSARNNHTLTLRACKRGSTCPCFGPKVEWECFLSRAGFDRS
jgi:hypothetical protein